MVNKVMYFRGFVLMITIAFRGGVVQANSVRGNGEEQAAVHTSGTEEGVKVTPECAVVLVTAGSIAGGTVTIATGILFSWLLGAIGFAAVGVEGGSYAALWQSTLPLVEAGSLFAKLQSIAMSGVATTVMPGSLIGGAAGAVAASTIMRDVCKVIDAVDPASNAGKTISVLGDALRQFRQAKDGDSGWKGYVKRGYDEAADGLSHVKDASWHYIHEMIHHDGKEGALEATA